MTTFSGLLEEATKDLNEQQLTIFTKELRKRLPDIVAQATQAAKKGAYTVDEDQEAEQQADRVVYQLKRFNIPITEANLKRFLGYLDDEQGRTDRKRNRTGSPMERAARALAEETKLSDAVKKAGGFSKLTEFDTLKLAMKPEPGPTSDDREPTTGLDHIRAHFKKGA